MYTLYIQIPRLQAMGCHTTHLQAKSKSNSTVKATIFVESINSQISNTQIKCTQNLLFSLSLSQNFGCQDLDHGCSSTFNR